MDTQNNSINKNEKISFLKNTLIVLIGNGISIISGFLVGFLIPKILGVSEYGYYKTFTLYSSYIGILHFGFVDGIYLKFAGKRYDELDKKQFRTFTRFFFLMQLIISSLFVVVSFSFVKSNYFFVILFVALNILAINVLSFFEYIGQATMQFKRTSFKSIVRSLLNISSVIILFLLYKNNEVVITNKIYIPIVLLINYFLALWYIVSFRQIVFGKARKFHEESSLIKEIFRVGIVLLLTNLIAQVVFTVDQQFVNIAFDNDTYSIYAFAYNMIQLITVATSAISVVLFPTLRHFSPETITRNYTKINSYLLILVSFCLLFFYPMELIVRWFLPKYIDSLVIFRIILPGVLVSTSISVVKYNCYKTFNKINNYLIKAIIILILSIIADIIAFYIFKETKWISIASIFILLCWYIMVEMYFVKKFRVKWIRNFIYMLAIISGFYCISRISSILLSASLYFIYFMTLTSIFYYREIKELIIKIKERKNIA